MRLTTIIFLLIVISLFFNGCVECEPEIKRVYVKSKVPKLKTLYKVKPYRLDDVKLVDETHYLIPKDDLEKASVVSSKRIRIINFYEKQNNKFNKEFASK